MAYKNILLIRMAIAIYLAFAGIILIAGCKTQEIETRWSAEPVKVDGKIMDWNNMPINYFEESGVGLGLCNDTEKLYILFRFNSSQWAQAIRMGGLTLWLDNSGKKKKDFGIRYTGEPLLPDLQKMGGSGEGGFEESLTPEQRQNLVDREKAMADQITFINKKSNLEIKLKVDGSGGPAVCFDSVGGIYAYEFSIPLQKGDAYDCAIGAKPGQTICLGLEWGGMGDRQSMRQGGGGMGMPPGGGPPGGGGGMPPGGGGMGGGPPGGGRSGARMQQPEKQEVWVKTKLASSPA